MPGQPWLTTRGAHLALMCSVAMSAAAEPPRCPGGSGGGTAASGWSTSSTSVCKGTHVAHPSNAAVPSGVTRAACATWCRSRPRIGCCASWAGAAANDKGECVGYSEVVLPAAITPTPAPALPPVSCTLCRSLHTGGDLGSLSDGGCGPPQGAGLGVVAASGRTACSELCVNNPSCAWVYSPSGSFGSDCTLVGECSPRGLTRGAGRIFSRACVSYGPASAPAPPGTTSLSMSHFLVGLIATTITFGTPAVLYCRCQSKRAKVLPDAVRTVTNGDGIGRSSSPPSPPQPPSDAAARPAPGAMSRKFRAWGHHVIRAQAAVDVLQAELFRRMIDENAHNETRQLTVTQEAQMCGVKGAKRAELRAKHRQQRQELSKRLSRVDAGLTSILQETHTREGEVAQLTGRPREVSERTSQASMKLVAQYDEHVKTMASQLKDQEASKAELLEQRLAEKRRQMQARLHAMELLLEKDKPKVNPLVARAAASGKQSKAQDASKHDELVGPEPSGHGGASGADERAP
jgi:hypothetical protein